MSAPSAVSAGARLEAMVARCRRRAGMLLVLRYSVVACAVTLGAISAVRVVQPERISEAALNALAIALGVICVAVAAFRRYPTPREVASAIDRHFDLDDSVVAALQAHRGNTTAAVAPLIVRQTVQRTADIHARDVFPMELRRPALMLAAGLVLTVAALPGGHDAANTRVISRAIGAPGGGAVGAAAGTQGARVSNSADQVSRNSAGRSEGGAAGTAQHNAHETDIPGTQGVRASSAPSGNTNSSAPNGAAGTAPQSGKASTEGVRGGNGAGETDGARGGIGTARSETRGDSTGSGGGGAARGTSRGTGSGGVRGGDLLAASRQPTTSTTTASTEQPARYRAAQRNAEAALTRGDIPPELRSYVREYFRAITR